MSQLGFSHFTRNALIASVLAWTALPGLAGSACTVTVLSALAFGPYDVFSASATTGTGSFAVRNCTSGKTAYTASLSTGSGTFANRSLSAQAPLTDKMQYNLYTDNTYTSIWGDGTNSSSTVNGNGTTRSTGGTTKTIYGRIPAAQDVSAGNYSDSITITISF